MGSGKCQVKQAFLPAAIALDGWRWVAAADGAGLLVRIVRLGAFGRP